MNIFGLTLEQYERVILLDSDILIIDDISALWQGDDFVVCYDCGDREYVAKSNYTSDFVFNSGVISIPKKHIGAAAFAEMKAIVMDSAREVCPLIDRFADQKAWNIFLRTRAKTVAAVNYNCNIKYVINSLGGRTEGVSIIHFAGPKPWAHKDYIHESLVEVRASKAARFDKLWLDHYRRLLYKTRLEQFRTYHDTTLRRSPVRNRLEDPGAGTCFMIGNGPSIQRTDMSILQDYEKFCYNWFILHKEFDIIRPEHLVLASHMFFGGWNVQEPKFPEGYYEKLMELKHRPVIWTSFVNREFFTNIGLDREFEVNYLMFEKPFKRFVDRVGVFRCDPSSFQDDARTGVISVGMVAASAMGFKRIALVGCDASYNRATSNSNYFYDEKLHTSLQTRSDSLTSTWEDGGRGQYVYKLAYEGLAERGIELVDCTVDGEIQHVPKVALEQFRVNPMKKVS
jgi:lipopolysaccharide biosynthesis glycosyltransferase